MSRLLLILPVAFLAFAYACGGGGGDDDTASVDPEQIPTATIPAVLPDPLIVGQSDVPGSSTTYIVQAGDTLLAIADQFGVSVEAIAEANDIADTASLAVGVELMIPGVPGDSSVLGSTDTPEATPEPTDEPEATEEPVPTDTPEPVDEEPPPDEECTGHVVQEGEYPEVIAPVYDLTTEELMAANPGLDPTTIQIGDCLNLP